MPKRKFYSVAQAEKTLPLVRRIIEDIVRAYRQRETDLAARRKLGAKPNPGSNTEEQAFRLERSIQEQESAILRYQQELTELGVELKDYRVGLVDFYSRYRDRTVYLCWKIGEPERLAWWHGLRAGFRGRQPITPENRSQFLGLREQPYERREA